MCVNSPGDSGYILVESFPHSVSLRAVFKHVASVAMRDGMFCSVTLAMVLCMFRRACAVIPLSFVRCSTLCAFVVLYVQSLFGLPCGQGAVGGVHLHVHASL